MADGEKPSAPHDPNAGRTWVEDVEGERARRRALARPFVDPKIGGKFRGGVEEMMRRGLVTIEPQGDRVLLEMILPEDAIGAEGSGLVQLEHDARHAVMMRIVAMAPGCRRYFTEHGYEEGERLKPGDFCWVSLVVADRMSARDKSCRVWSVPVRYIASRVVFTQT